MSASYEDQLRRELSRVGIRGPRRRRIVAEIADHLACEPSAMIGEPAVLADRFADELGTRRAQRAGVLAFLALAVAGILFGVVLASSARGNLSWPRVHSGSMALYDIGVFASLLGCQIAFVTGLLGGLRALRLRDALVIPRAEATVIARRAAVGVAAGLVTMAGVALVAIEVGASSWWTALALSGAGTGALALLAVAPVLAGSLRLRPVGDGTAGDLFEDVGRFTPPPLRGRPWRFAVTVAAMLALATTLAGVAQSDGYDGALRGMLEALACLAGFRLLGRYLSLVR